MSCKIASKNVTNRTISLAENEKRELLILKRSIDYLKMALETPITETGVRAFVFLSKGSYSIVQALTQDNRFYIIANTLLDSKEKDPAAISRLSTIFLTVVDFDVDHMTESAKLMCRFVSYVDSTGVFDLISSSISPNRKNPIFMKELLKCDFVNIIFNELQIQIKNLEQTDFSSIYSPTEEFVSNLLFLIRQLAKNKSTYKYVLNENTISSLIFICNVTSLNIQNNLWQTISAVGEKITIKKLMSPLFFKAIALISGPYVNLHMYHTCAIDFLGKCVNFEPNLFDDGVFEQLIQVISRLIAQFPSSSNLQASISRFILAAFKHIDKNIFAEKIFGHLLPLIIYTAQLEARSASAANCVFILQQISVMKFTNSAIRKYLKQSNMYKRCSEKFLTCYEDMLKQNYGGNTFSFFDLAFEDVPLKIAAKCSLSLIIS